MAAYERMILIHYHKIFRENIPLSRMHILYLIWYILEHVSLVIITEASIVVPHL